MPRGKHLVPPVSVVLPEPLNTQLREQAQREGRHLSDLLRESAANYLKETTMSTMTTSPAEIRVSNSETLSAYRDLLLDYDWSNQEEHLEWVATAPEAEIIAWAETIRRDERSA